MTKSTSIRPSAETLVVGARVLLRNGVTAVVTAVMGEGDYPVRTTTADRFTLGGRYLAHARSAMDIVEVLPEEAADIVNLSKLKVGDTLVFKSGRTAEVIEAAEWSTDYCFHVVFQYSDGSTASWNYENDGSWCGLKNSEHTIVKVIHKERPIVDVSKVKVGDTLEFAKGDTAVVTETVRVGSRWCEVYFRMANGYTDCWVYTLDGLAGGSQSHHHTIVKVIHKERPIVDVSKVKVGDTLEFAKGDTAVVTETVRVGSRWCEVYFRMANGYTDCWVYTLDGLAGGSQSHHHTIVKVIHKERPVVDVSKVKVGDTLEFVNGETAVVTETVHADIFCYEVHFRMANGATDFWFYTHDGLVGGIQSHRHTIVEHIPKITPAPQEDTSASPVPNPVSHPSHYTSHPSGVECIQVTQHMTFNLGNVVKYVWRNGLKDSGGDDLQDLKKAQWYLNKEIERLEATEA